MGMVNEVTTVAVEAVFKICPTCGYKNGFHAMFERIEKSDTFSWKLICPTCEKIYDIGLRVRVKGTSS
jgi:hypothetical protein